MKWLIYCFIAASVLGWFLEVSYRSIKAGKFVNPGFLYGCYLPIYGFGMLMILGIQSIAAGYALPVKFIAYFFAMGSLEFFSGWALDKLFRIRLWDYFDQRFNIKGYVSLSFSFYWACMALVIDVSMGSIAPSIVSACGRLQSLPDIIISTIAIIMAADLIITLIRRLKLYHESFDKGVLKEEFISIASDLFVKEDVSRLKDCNHHFGKTRLDHVLQVSWMAYRMSRLLSLDGRATIRGALLHDLFYYDWLREGPRFHGFRHPGIALKNAEMVTELSVVERDIIKKHMWPLTVIPPRYPESWAVCISDIYCSWSDYIIPFLIFLTRQQKGPDNKKFPSYECIIEERPDNGNLIPKSESRGKKLNILLIDAQPRSLPYTSFRTLTLPRLAGATPEKHTVRIIDGRVEKIEIPGEGIDLVGVTFSCNNSMLAYDIAQEAASLGIKTVAGGPHATAVPEEVLEHFDSVLIGEAEGGAWEKLLNDMEKGSLESRYMNETPPDISDLKSPRVDLLRSRFYLPVYPVEATRGCPNRCSFCFNRYIHPTYRKRPVEKVIEDISRSDLTDIIFMDDNLPVDSEYAKELFTAIRPLKKRFYFQTQLSVAADEELVSLAAQAGCKGVFVGLESINNHSLDSVSKSFNNVKRYKELLSVFDKYGIFVIGGMIFGLDADDESVFRQTLDFLNESSLCSVAANLPIPYPGTDFHTCAEKEGRLLQTHSYENYTGYSVIVRPKAIGTDALENGYRTFLNEFYSPVNILNRFMKQQRSLRQLPVFIMVNLALWLPRRSGRRGLWG
jgi:uncharacterized protein